MNWRPWKRDLKEAREVKAKAEERAALADGLVRYSSRIDDALQKQHEENGWTRQLTLAMQQKWSTES